MLLYVKIININDIIYISYIYYQYLLLRRVLKFCYSHAMAKCTLLVVINMYIMLYD